MISQDMSCPFIEHSKDIFFSCNRTYFAASVTWIFTFIAFVLIAEGEDRTYTFQLNQGYIDYVKG